MSRTGPFARNLLLGILCTAVLTGILVAGLWPFHAPKNGVTWLKGRNGLRFGDYGTAMSMGALLPRDAQFCTVELWLEPLRTDNSGTILTFYNRKSSPTQLSVHQSLGDLMLQLKGRGATAGLSTQKIYAGDVFRQGKPVFVSIAGGPQGTSVYIDGTLLRTAQGFPLMPGDCTGRLILGDSPRQQDTWSGQIRLLAIYSSELTAPAVLRHYISWKRLGRPTITERDRIVALYVFDEGAGNIVHDQAGVGAGLVIPGAYSVVDKIVFEPFWDEFSMSWGFWKNVLKNIAGFVPLGLFFYPYLALVHQYKRAALAAVILGFAVSLTIEVLQGYLPTRDSGTTDLITNTLGTWIGVQLYKSYELALRVRGSSTKPVAKAD